MEDTTPASAEGSEPTGRSAPGTFAIARLVNVASVSVGGLYLSTRSIAVTVIGAALVAVLLLVALVLIPLIKRQQMP